jgi:hypothetical protein
MRYVLDTSMLVAVVRSNVGASNRLVEAALLQRYTSPATTNLFFGYQAVLTRPSISPHQVLAWTNVRDFGVVPERFNIRVLRPGDALAGLEKRKSL